MVTKIYKEILDEKKKGKRPSNDDDSHQDSSFTLKKFYEKNADKVKS